MFAGLFLVPWVFLYGVSAFLFNHPDAFPDREVRVVSAGRGRRARPWTACPTPTTGGPRRRRAQRRSGGARFRLDAPAGATLSRPLTVTATGRGREHSVRYDLESGTATSGRRPCGRGRPATCRTGKSSASRTRRANAWPVACPRSWGRLGIEADAVTVRNPPDLIFDLEADDGRWRVAYNLQTERLSIRRADDPSGRLSTRRFLTGLHLAFGYPSQRRPAVALGPDGRRDGPRHDRLGRLRPDDVVADEVVRRWGPRPRCERGRGLRYWPSACMPCSPASPGLDALHRCTRVFRAVPSGPPPLPNPPTGAEGTRRGRRYRIEPQATAPLPPSLGEGWGRGGGEAAPPESTVTHPAGLPDGYD